MAAALIVVATWSATEAAVFFLVADIPISWIAVRHGTRAALLAAVVAALASIVGTMAVLWWAGSDPDSAARIMAALPGIDAAMVAEAADRFHKGPHAVLAGAFSGIPFKLFALEAARQPALGFLLLAPLLRLPRFLAVALFAGTISELLTRWMTVRQRLALLAAIWVAFYALYFAVMPR
jgi:hypothetical protein